MIVFGIFWSRTGFVYFLHTNKLIDGKFFFTCTRSNISQKKRHASNR